MICLTSDIHHQSLGTGNQAASDIPEVEAAHRFLDRLEAAGIRATYFLTGRLLEEEAAETERFCRSPLLEIGGHTYECFEPCLFHRVSKKLLGSYPGPAWYERRDIRRTVELVEARTGRPCKSWRNHMYMRGPHTDRLLAEAGVEICSDGTDRHVAGPRRQPSGLLHMPLNVIPDHEHLFHAERTPAWVAWWRQRYEWTDAFGGESYFVDEWAERVLAQLAANEARGAVSCLILHPITMYLCDGFRACDRILEYIATRETIHMGTLADRAAAPTQLEEAA